MIEIPRQCSTCQWWRAFADSDTGICLSVRRNEYSGAYLASDDERAELVTNAEFACADWSKRDSHRDE